MVWFLLGRVVQKNGASRNAWICGYICGYIKTWIMVDNDEMRYPHISRSKSQHKHMQTNIQNKSVKMAQ